MECWHCGCPRKSEAAGEELSEGKVVNRNKESVCDGEDDSVPEAATPAKIFTIQGISETLRKFRTANDKILQTDPNAEKNMTIPSKLDSKQKKASPVWSTVDKIILQINKILIFNICKTVHYKVLKISTVLFCSFSVYLQTTWREFQCLGKNRSSWKIVNFWLTVKISAQFQLAQFSQPLLVCDT